ncbi:sigma-70 family RNA polymerase sigma factor [Sorangium sp. So ce136]|uniref:RNA polymerase sigma factor n=1 Tax=Sorangium sp. So ce136 TaxID=3133284 RepID=UPI003F00D030
MTTLTSLNGAAPAPPGSDRFRRLARALRVPAQDVDDVVQQAWLRILENRARVGLATDAAAYVDQIVRNEARTSRRRARRREEVVAPLQGEEPSDERPGPEACVIARQRAEVLWRFIDRLDDARRTVFIEHELLGRTLAEIAGAHALSENTVKSRLAAAWDKVERERARWQAERRRRGQPAAPCFVPFFVPFTSGAWLHDTLRGLRRLGLHGTAITGLVLGAGAAWPGPAAGFAEAPLLAASGRAQPALEIPAAPADQLGVGPSRPERAIRREAFTASAASIHEGSSTTARAVSAAVEMSSRGGTGAEHARIDPRIERARAMLDLGTTEGQLSACRLLHEHRERRGRGDHAVERDALLRRVRCERHGSRRAQQ